MTEPMGNAQGYPISKALDAEIRELAVLHRADAFDNVDLDKMLKDGLSPWRGRAGLLAE